MSSEMMDKFRDIINNYKNPYPEDIYEWTNTDKMFITRGRFNELIHKIVENMRKNLMHELIVLKIETEKEATEK